MTSHQNNIVQHLCAQNEHIWRLCVYNFIARDITLFLLGKQSQYFRVFPSQKSICFKFQYSLMQPCSHSVTTAYLYIKDYSAGQTTTVNKKHITWRCSYNKWTWVIEHGNTVLQLLAHFKSLHCTSWKLHILYLWSIYWCAALNIIKLFFTSFLISSSDFLDNHQRWLVLEVELRSGIWGGRGKWAFYPAAQPSINHTLTWISYYRTTDYRIRDFDNVLCSTKVQRKICETNWIFVKTLSPLHDMWTIPTTGHTEML